jgi:hypothetical protein
MKSGPGRSEMRARSVTLVVCVAEKSIVCRFSFGRRAMICFISSSKPISRMRSASSMTSALTFLKMKPFVFCQNSKAGCGARGASVTR